MIVWEGVGVGPQSPEVLRVLLERGLVQHLRLDEKMIPAAQASQQAGGTVILMQGGGGPWPAQLAGPPENGSTSSSRDTPSSRATIGTMTTSSRA
jgi:hypothetical protein